MPDSLPIPLTSPLSRAQQTSLVNLVRRAAKTEIMPHFRNLGHADISAKADRFDLVTAADIAAEAMLARGGEDSLSLARDALGRAIDAAADDVRARALQPMAIELLALMDRDIEAARDAAIYRLEN